MRYFVMGDDSDPMVLVRIDFMAGQCDGVGTLGTWRRAPAYGRVLWGSDGEEVSADRAQQIASGWGTTLDAPNRQPETSGD